MTELMPRDFVKTTIAPPEGAAQRVVESILQGWASDLEPVEEIAPTEAGQKASAEALAEIRGRSFSGRHPELGKMINCQFCGFRHRENEPNFHCKQKFATTEDNVVYGELTPPDGLTHLTARQILGAQFFSKKRINSHSNRWAKARANKAAAIQRKKNEVAIEA